MEDYGDLKSRLLLTTALLTVGGSGVAAIASGMDAAVPFALGGVLGLLYQLLLQFGADAALSSAAYSTSSAAAFDAYAAAAARSSGTVNEDTGRSTESTSPAHLSHSNSRLLRIVGSSAVRLLLLVTAAFSAVLALQDRSGRPVGDGKPGAEAKSSTSANVFAHMTYLLLLLHMPYLLLLLHKSMSLVPAPPC